MKFTMNNDKPSIIKVIGVGGGGSNAVNYMYKKGIEGVDFAVCNTDAQALEMSPVPTKIQLGPSLTNGLGAGSKPQIGRQSCVESIEDIKNFLNTGTRMLFITAGMGGGTGTGAAPVIAKQAREMGILTVAIVSLPFSFEGSKRITQGHEGLAELKKDVDTIIVISNDKVKSIHRNLGMSQAFANADDILAIAAKGIAEIITVKGYVNVDFEDVNTVMRDSGVAIMGTGRAEGEDRAIKAVDMALTSPLLEDTNIYGAKQILLNIACGNKEVTMDEISQITDFVQVEAGADTNLIWGNCFDDSLGDFLSVTIIATGFEQHERETVKTGTRDTRVALDDDEPISLGQITDSIATDSKGQAIIEFDTKPKNPFRNNPYANEEPYFKPKTQPVQKETVGFDYEVERPMTERPKQDLSKFNPQQKTLAEIEEIPSYIRRGLDLSNKEEASYTYGTEYLINDSGETEHSPNRYLKNIAD